MTLVIDSILETYLRAYRDLLGVEHIGNSAIISFPFHLAANHRIEITVTEIGKDQYIISDAARTLGEIQAAGFSMTPQMQEKLMKVASLPELGIVDTHLVLQSNLSDLGPSIQKFLEVTKMIGDVYLVHRQREKPVAELEEVQEVEATIARAEEPNQ